MSLALSLSSLAVSLTACAGAAVFAIRARAMRIQAEKDAARATRISGEQRIKQHLEDSGSYAGLVSVGERGCDTVLPERQGNRPTHSDGTAYRYHEIVAEGWEHCDGCRRWGQWTVDNPHDCLSTVIQGPAVDVQIRPNGSPAQIGDQVARAIRRGRRGGS